MTKSAYFPTMGVTSQAGTVYKVGDNYTGFAAITTLKSGSDAMLLESPLSNVRGGGVTPALRTDNMGVLLAQWSATASTVGTYTLYVNSGRIFPGNDSNNRDNGYTVRCVQGI